MILKAYTVLINVTKISLQEQNKDQMTESKEVVAKAIADIITLLRWESQQIIFGSKGSLRISLL